MKKLLLLFVSCYGALQASAQEPTPVEVPDTTVTSTFTKVDVEAAYLGGQKAWMTYLTNNINGDAAGKDVVIPKGVRQVTHTAIVQFIVASDGRVTDARVVNQVPRSVAREALRVITNSGQWVPAQQNGRMVKAYRRQPITFVFTP